MQKLLVLQLIGALLLVFAFSGCDIDRCENVICDGPESVCVDGVCICPPGYEGPNCDVLSSDKYVGNYRVNESCNPGTARGWSFTNVTLGNGIDKLVFGNVLNTGLSAEAVIVNEFAIRFDSQNLGSIQFAGVGNYIQNTNRIEIEYEYYVNGTANRCVAFLNRQ